MIGKTNRFSGRAIVALLLASSLLSLGCNNAKEGAVSGAAIGALSGLAIGSLSGNAGKGAAIGAIAGGVGGAVIGDQNRRKTEQEEAAAAAAARQTPPQTVVVMQQQPYQTGQALGRLVGQWRVNGTIDNGTGAALPINGTARGIIDKTYFVRLDLSFTDPRNNQPIAGTSVVSQTGGRGLQMTNSFSTSPTVNHFRGEMDPSGSVFEMKQFDPPGSSRQIIIRLLPGNQWAADAWDGGRRTESMTFTWVGP